jgi:hypothetical protein
VAAFPPTVEDFVPSFLDALPGVAEVHAEIATKQRKRATDKSGVNLRGAIDTSSLRTSQLGARLSCSGISGAVR